MEPSIDKAIDAVKAGGFAAEDYGSLSHLGAGGCSLAPMQADLVPADVAALVEARETAIRNGGHQVAINDEEPKSTR
jgi:hypothetical protein